MLTSVSETHNDIVINALFFHLVSEAFILNTRVEKKIFFKTFGEISEDKNKGCFSRLC